MNENDLERLLKKAIFSENGPDPSEEEIEACLRADHEDTPETIARVKKRFVEKMFLEISPNPLRSAADNITFGDFLESQRDCAGLQKAEVSTALGIAETLVDALEKGRTPPWTVAPNIIADIMHVFRIHFDLLKRLVETSAAVDQLRGVGPVLARSKGGKMTSDRGDSTSRALERFFARNATRTEPNKETTSWLASLESYLREESENQNYKELI